jgi:hypothetical protein
LWSVAGAEDEFSRDDREDRRVSYNQTMQMLDRSSYRRLDSVAEVVVPSFETLTDEERNRFRAIIDQALAERPPEVVKQLSLFLKVVTMAPVLRWGRTLGSLDAARAERALRWFQESRIGKLRQGFWGLRTLVFMGYYGRTECWPVIGYAPEFDGRGGLGDRQEL